MKKLFLLSGLGADKRVFDFLDLSAYSIYHVIWVKPVTGESMADYAKRLLPQITDDKPVLMGVSFGGMIALEISKLMAVEKVILISSAKSTAAIPPMFKWMARLRIQKLMPAGALKQPTHMLYWLFGVSTKEHRALLSSIMADTDEIFFTWAIETITSWKNEVVSASAVQIHGTNDRILSLQTADHIIKGGGHLMVVTHAKEISDILKNILR
jgi:pimeloyl-ACP methyl ester carboxylesterase